MIYDWRTIGGATTDTPGLLPARLLEVGWERYALEMAESVAAFGAEGGLILHNGGGQWEGDGKPKMRLDQFKFAPPNVGGYWPLYRATRILLGVAPRVWWYLGRTMALDPDLSEIEDAIRPIVNAGGSIIIDSAGSEDERGRSLYDGTQMRTPSWPVACLLRAQGVEVGYEPRPNLGSPFASAADMTCFVRSNTWERTDPAKHEDAARVYCRNEDIAGPVALLHPIDGPGVDDIKRQADDVARMVAGGANVGTYGSALVKYVGLTARDLEAQATELREQGAAA